MVFCCQHNILCAGFLEKLRPFPGIPVFRLPHGDKVLIPELPAICIHVVFVSGAPPHIDRIIIPFCVRVIAKPLFVAVYLSQFPCPRCKCRDGIDAPVDKNSEFAVFIPCRNRMLFHGFPGSCISCSIHSKYMLLSFALFGAGDFFAFTRPHFSVLPFDRPRSHACNDPFLCKDINQDDRQGNQHHVCADQVPTAAELPVKIVYGQGQGPLGR